VDVRVLERQRDGRQSVGNMGGGGARKKMRGRAAIRVYL
jgi:hypothetical protein